MDSDAREVTKLYRAYKTIHEMVHDRVSFEQFYLF